MINVKYGTSIIERCLFKGNNAINTDAIDYDQIKKGIIRDCIIFDFYGRNSDGIDLGEQCDSVLVERNFINNCTDKGISVGQASTTVISNNIITNCNMAVGIKDSASYAFITDNSFYKNNYGVSCFQKNLEAGGGSAVVVNTIFSLCTGKQCCADSLSSVSVSYSLFDKILITGTGNIYASPLFKSPETMDFLLQDNSPCINAGDPLLPPDSDGSISDIGADFIQYTDNGNINPKIVKKNSLIQKISIFPNPLRNYGIIKFKVNEQRDFRVSVFLLNIKGRTIKTITDEKGKIGEYSISFSTSDLGSGIYFLKIFAGKLKIIKKIFVIR